MSEGYIRRDNCFEHRIIWEQHYGKIPNGYFIHHINGIKTDNRIENFQLVDSLTHNRIHHGYQLINNVWWKKCRRCGELKQVNTDFITNKVTNRINTVCNDCFRNYGRQKWHKHKLTVKDEDIDTIVERLSKNKRSKYQQIDGEWYKPCCKCGELKHVKTEFKKAKNRMMAWCKECKIIYDKKYTENNKPKLKEYNKEYRTERENKCIKTWEDANGKIPEGMKIYHINSRNDDSLENLMISDEFTHRRMTLGYELRDGVWYKPCADCGEMKCVDTDYYHRKTGVVGSQCKQCGIKASVAYKQRKKQTK